MWLSSNLLLVLVRILLFSWFIHLIGVLCPVAQALSFYQVFHLFSTGVLFQIFLTPSSIHSIVTEAVYCDFIKYLLILSSSYSIPFLFNRSAARSCSPLFLSCFNRSVFNFVHLRCIPSLNLFNLLGFFWFHSFVKEAT